MNQRRTSEVCFGLVLKGAEPGVFNPEHFSEPYNSALQDVGRMGLPELKANHGFDAMRTAELAAEGISIDEAADWARLLQTRAVQADVGKRLVRIGEKLKEGEGEDSNKILQLASQLDRGESGFVSMADVALLREDEIWAPCGYEPIDANAGGLPYAGLTIVSGPAKLGKTTLLLRLLAENAKRGLYSAFFSLEMRKELAKARLLQVEGLTNEQMDFIRIIDEPMNEARVQSEAIRLASEYDLKLIGVDYASKMLYGRPPGVESMSSIYMGMGDLSKNSEIPTLLIAGVSRNYVGGEADVSSIWYSGIAEHEASLIIIVHNPALLDIDMSSKNKAGLPYVPGMGYLKFGASRLGLKRGSLGAAQVRWNDENGTWGSRTLEWYPHYSG